MVTKDIIKNNGRLVLNGNLKFILTLLIIVFGFGAGWASIKSSVENIAAENAQIKSDLAGKVAQGQYAECMKGLEREIQNIRVELNHVRAEQREMAQKLDRLLLRVGLGDG